MSLFSQIKKIDAKACLVRNKFVLKFDLMYLPENFSSGVDMKYKHVKNVRQRRAGSKLMYIYTRKNAQLVTNLQQTCSKLVGTNLLQDLFARLVPACWQVATSLQQTCCKLDELNSLVTSCSNNLLSCCNQQLVNKLWVTYLVQLDKITALLQLVDKLVTSLLRTQLFDKLWDFYVCMSCILHPWPHSWGVSKRRDD